MTKNKNANRHRDITIENSSSTGSLILSPVCDLEVGEVTKYSLDASEVFRMLERETGTGRVRVYLSAILCLDWPSSSQERRTGRMYRCYCNKAD